MNEFYQEKAASTWVWSDVSVLAPLRGYLRLVVVMAWLMACCACIRVARVALAFSKEYRRRVCRKIARVWLRGMPRLLGLRIIEHGKRPDKPLFIVTNHITWVDFITMNLLCDGRCVAMAEMKDAPFMGTLTQALEAIFVYRVRDDVPRVRQEIADTMEQGRTVLLAPEGVISPGRTVRRFRASLLEPAARLGKPVNYASITYRTPDGCPPPSDTVLFGPDPHFRPDDDEVNNLELWGPKRSFGGHFHRFVSMPYHEVHVRFGDEPIHDCDSVTLANNLHRAVRRIFTPLQ